MDHTHPEGSAIAVGGAAVTTCVLPPAGKALDLPLEAHGLPRQVWPRGCPQCGAQEQ